MLRAPCRRHSAAALLRTRLHSTVVSALRARLSEELPELADFVGGRTSQTPRATAVDEQLQRPLAEGVPSLGEARVTPELTDRFLRRHTYLRISLTERCSLRCTYCMPAQGVDLSPEDKLLSPAEVQRLAAMFVRAGVDKIRLTGGEPTVRRDIVDVVAGLNELRPHGLRQIAMTSNGIALPRLLRPLQEAGLDRLNISLDTLSRELFTQLTRRDGLGRVLKAIDLAQELGYSHLKVNVVLMAGVNEDELLDFAALAVAKSIDVRFIEYMPFDGNEWSMGKIVPHSRVMASLRGAYPDLVAAGNDAHDVAVTWRPEPDARGTVSLISSMTQPFCSGCNRIRLTADGMLKTCLFGADEVSLRDVMRAGATDGEVMAVVGGALGRKHARHAGMSTPQMISEMGNRPMTTIGG